MTKMKSKKMTKSTFAIIIMAIVMVAMLAFGGTYAYFTAQTSKASTTVTTAQFSVEDNTESVLIATGGIVVPNQPIVANKVTVTPTMNTNIILIGQISLIVDPENKVTGESLSLADLDYTVNSNWVKAADGTYIYAPSANAKLAASETTKAIEFTTDKIVLSKDVKGTENMNVEIQVNVQFFACQYDFLTSTAGQVFEGTSAKDCYTAVQTLAITTLPACTIA